MGEEYIKQGSEQAISFAKTGVKVSSGELNYACVLEFLVLVLVRGCDVWF